MTGRYDPAAPALSPLASPEERAAHVGGLIDRILAGEYFVEDDVLADAVVRALHSAAGAAEPSVSGRDDQTMESTAPHPQTPLDEPPARDHA